MDKVLSETIEELGNSRISAKEMFDKYTKYRTLSSIAVRKYNDIKTMISDNYKRGSLTTSDIGFDIVTGRMDQQLQEIIITLLKEDGLYIEQQTTPYHHYLIAWDERIPAVKYAVDGSEYQKLRAMIENPSTKN